MLRPEGGPALGDRPLPLPANPALSAALPGWAAKVEGGEGAGSGSGGAERRPAGLCVSASLRVARPLPGVVELWLGAAACVPITCAVTV